MKIKVHQNKMVMVVMVKETAMVIKDLKILKKMTILLTLKKSSITILLIVSLIAKVT